MDRGRRGSAALIILLIIVVLAVTGGIWYYTSKPTASAPTSSYAGWQSYRDVADGITFQYPPIVSAPTPSSTEVNAEDQTRVWFYGVGKTNELQPPMLVFTVVPSATGTLENFETQMQQGEPSADFHFQSITVNGEDAAIYSGALSAAPNTSAASLFFFHDQKQYVLQLLTVASSSISVQGTLSQIANSVQFDH
jgi:hypothetical protein